MRSQRADRVFARAFVLAVAAAVFVPGFAPPVHAETCADALGCATDTLGDATDIADGAVDATEETAASSVSDVADTVPDPIDEVTDPVLDDVVAVLGPGGAPDPVADPSERTNPADDDVNPDGGSTGTGAGSPSGDRHASPDGAPREGPFTTQHGRVNLPPADGAGPIDATPPVRPTTRLQTGPDEGGTIARVARAIGFPAALVAVMLLFLVLQQRADRRDPKLSRAPLDRRDDTLAFR